MREGAAGRPAEEPPEEPPGEPVGLRFRAHPWHGVAIGERAPEVVTAYVEIVPTDTVKYEIDKVSGYLTVDRPQQFSNVCPTLYGFVPRTHCAARVAARCAERTGRTGIVGDGDPLDICVLAEKAIPRGDILLRAVPIGGLRMLDGDEADDKLIAVLEGDAVYGAWRDVDQCPPALLDRLRHYFLTYKEPPGDRPERPRVEIAEVYGRAEAHEVIRRSQQDYAASFGQPGAPVARRGAARARRGGIGHAGA
jgi:inorganic pyrophosphatase